MRIFKCLLIALLASTAPLFAQDRPSSAETGPKAGIESPSGDSQILPQQFGGWQLSGAKKSSADPSAADPVNAGLLKEYGFNDFESATYTRPDGRKLLVKAARFADASGSYGAFTYYRLPQMLVERFGDLGASLNERVLFYRYNVLVDAVFDKRTAMTGSQLRELSEAIARPAGNAGNRPTLPGHLPGEAKLDNSEKYVAGPIGWEKVGAPLPAQLVNFNVSPEIATSDYNTSSGKIKLVLVAYPTPQIAADQMQQIEAAQGPRTQNTTQPAATPEVSSQTGPVLPGHVYQKRTGPILALVLGTVSESEAKSLLASVNYDADVTWNENTHFTKKDNVANLLVNAIVLCGILGAMAIIAGLAFGGLRILLRRLYPERMMASEAEREFISLHLSQDTPEPAIRTPERS